MNTAVSMLYVFLIFSILGCGKNDLNNSKIEINSIPDNAQIIFHENNFIYVMDKSGENLTQITFDNSQVLEHLAVSYDRTKIVANYFTDPSIGGETSKLIVFDIESKTMTPLLPEFEMSGNGGVDWDSNGNIYFAAVSKRPFANPNTIEEFKANAGANDIYSIRFDGTNLLNLTNTTNYGEADVSVSPDDNFISYTATNIIDPENSFTEIWKREINGNNAQLLYVGGENRVSSVHDPEISPDGNYVIFSQVNSEVPPNFPNDPFANTAHDIIRLNLSNANDITTITQPGPISIVPDWKNGKILFLEITDQTNPPQAGLALVNEDGSGYGLIKNGANIGKWIPN